MTNKERLEALYNEHWHVERDVIHAENEVKHQKVFLSRVEMKIRCLEKAMEGSEEEG